ncbi:hypothetical protein QVD17_13643 [Tagetes erecta]|uniref:AT-hook motif nuclear-localized protein n=1 Tax=Tagetes erecta TaxID=13708 RepID=A0AAD8L0B1_TARER|nr:hypothetical protein QVD17_13643 [Tagetes erecta]
MDSRHHQFPPGMMMMPPTSYTIHNNSVIAPPNNNSIIPHESMQQRFNFDASDQFNEGSSFRASEFNVEPAKKKRGRPRKYSPSSDGNIALGLAPVTSGGQLECLNGGGGSNGDSMVKKQRGRPPGSGKKQLDALGAAGVGFTPHVITVKAGEDVASKMTAFSQEGPRNVCILSANGAISNVTLRQPAMSAATGTVTYEGRFEIISLSGSFMLTDSNGNHSSRASGLSVSLAGSDGRVLGGGVVGPLVAATPIQVVVGSFITDAKKPKSSSSPTVPTPSGNMLNFGGGTVPGASPPSDRPSSESSEDSGSNQHLHRHPGSYINASQQAPPPQMQMYSNMGWPNSTMNMLRN